MKTEKPDDVGADATQQPYGGRCGATGGDHVVDEEDLLALEDCVRVHFERVHPVLELVVLPHRVERELARFAQRHESGPDMERHGRGEREAAGLDTGDLGDAQVGVWRGHRIDQGREGLGMAEDRGYVLEDDALFREVWDVANQGFEVGHRLSLRPVWHLPESMAMTSGEVTMTSPRRSGLVPHPGPDCPLGEADLPVLDFEDHAVLVDRENGAMDAPDGAHLGAHLERLRPSPSAAGSVSAGDG